MQRVALIHDWLVARRGGEKVLEALLELFPKADVHTLFYRPERVSEAIRSHRIIVSSLNKNPLMKRFYPFFLTRLPRAAEAMDLDAYDLVISSSHCVAKGVIPRPDALHLAYIHSPMRYAWDQYQAYFGSWPRPLRGGIERRIHRLRQWDVSSSARVDTFVANSSFVAQRIRRYYRREVEVIHPPVDTSLFAPTGKPSRRACLVVSALVPYKRVDRVIGAFNRTGQPLRILGQGSELGRLRRMARSNITFLGHLPPERLREELQNARALVYGGVEDFGISFVEALACGTPVVAPDRGGVRDIVTPDCGILFPDQEPEGWEEALRLLERRFFDPGVLVKRAQRFGKDRFLREMKTCIEAAANGRGRVGGAVLSGREGS